MSKKDDFNDLSGVNAKALGNFTKNAIKQFENNIVNQTDYLEKVEEATQEDKS
ncbi:hypothetical protein [Candidatus Clostridium radicumherbarum]|uniref:Uncharacterized protein n=1 Tax=Candidatus Clostridium radicumherbarum TaxID=3381662 RepID=A0ABW8TVH0_9CLOT